MRVLICRSNPIAPDPRVEKIAQALASSGYCVMLLGWDRTAMLPAASQLPAAVEAAAIQVHRLPIRAEYGTGLGNLPNLLRWQVGLFRWLARRRDDYDVIHACDFDTVLPALACKILWRKRLVYDIFDFYADHLRSTPGPLKRIIRALDLKVIGWADATILVDDSRWEQIRGSKPKRSAVIYNSPQEPASRILPERSPDSVRLRLAYIGLLQVERGLFQVLEILSRHPEWTLDLAGFGGDEEQLHRMALQLPNVTWHGRVRYEEALRLSGNADVLFATYDPAIPNHRYSSPNKVFEAMMLGKPIIVARSTNMDRMIQEADCGIVVEYGDVSGLEEALSLLQNDPELRLRLGRNARQAYESTYSWSEMQARLLRLYQQVAS